MAVTQYIGARYVPLMADPIEWSNAKSYEPLTIVLHQGASYTSKQFVPVGIDIDNTDFWALTGNYNAQVEQYRQEVQTFNSRITANTAAIAENTANIATNASDIQGALADIAQQREDIDANTSNIAENAIDIAANTDAIADNEQAILSNSAAIATNTANIATNTSNISANASAIDALEAKVDTLNPMQFMAFNGYEMVAFGDSFIAPNIANSVDAYLPKRVAAAIGATLHNFAVAGAGFARSNNTLGMQLTTAIQTMTAQQVENTRLVLAYAGFNDWNNDVSATSMGDAVKEFVINARAAFENALILVIPMNWQFSQLNHAAYGYIYNMLRTCNTFNTNGVVMLEGAWAWILGYPTLFQNQVHPNINGYNVIAAHILNVLSGGSPLNNGRSNALNIAANTDLSAGILNISYDTVSCTVTVGGYVRKDSDGTANITFLNGSDAPVFFPADLVIIPVTALTGTADGCYIRLNPEGTMVAHFSADYVSGSNLWFSSSYQLGAGSFSWSDVN